MRQVERLPNGRTRLSIIVRFAEKRGGAPDFFVHDYLHDETVSGPHPTVKAAAADLALFGLDARPLGEVHSDLARQLALTMEAVR